MRYRRAFLQRTSIFAWNTVRTCIQHCLDPIKLVNCQSPDIETVLLTCIVKMDPLAESTENQGTCRTGDMTRVDISHRESIAANTRYYGAMTKMKLTWHDRHGPYPNTCRRTFRVGDSNGDAAYTNQPYSPIEKHRIKDVSVIEVQT